MDALATARSLSASRPSATLPCPLCAVSVKAANLDAHVAKVHPSATPALPPWTGVDRRVMRSLAIALGLVATAMTALGASGVAPPGSPLAWALVAAVTVLGAALFAAFVGVMRATLSLDGDAITLRHTLGLGRVTARLSSAITVGPLVARRASVVSPDHDPDPVTTRTGWYLRLGPLVVGCRQSTSFASHWSERGWTRGPRRFTCDVIVPQRVMVALEYALASRGALTPKD
ncbi:MAG: hypothetical protein R3A52_15655 [Polyangiales bacterium]